MEEQKFSNVVEDMEIELCVPEYFKRGVHLLSNILTEAHIRFTKSYIQIIAMHPANVCLVDFKIKEDVFSKYKVDKPFHRSIVVLELVRLLNSIKTSSVLRIKKIDEQHLGFKILDQYTTTSILDTRLAEYPKDHRKPELKPKIVSILSSFVFKEQIEALYHLSESIKFCKEGNNLVFKAESDLGKCTIENSESGIYTFDAESVKDQGCKYSAEYLLKFVDYGVIPLSASVIIAFSESCPLSILYSEKQKVELEFILAPRVESD